MPDLEPAIRLVCARCGTTENVHRCPHSLAELGLPGNPPHCPTCNLEAPR